MGKCSPSLERAQQMHGHVVPIAAKIDGNVHAAESRVLIPVIPESIMRGMLDAHLLPEPSKWLFAVMALHEFLQHGRNSFAVHVLHPFVYLRQRKQIFDYCEELLAPHLRVSGSHYSYGRQPRRDESGAKYPVVPGCIVGIVGRCDG